MDVGIRILKYKLYEPTELNLGFKLFIPSEDNLLCISETTRRWEEEESYGFNQTSF